MKFKTLNPSTGQNIKEYETISKQQALDAAKKSYDAFQIWRNLSIEQRSKYIRSLANILKENKNEYGKIMTLEMGKPIRESIPEVEKCAWLGEVLAENAEEWLKEEIIVADGVSNIITYEPLGVIFIIMPWNYPFWQVFKVALPPLMAGNTIILKHARNVTGSALMIEDAFSKAGFPKGVFQNVIVDHESSSALIESKYVAACSLTGSVGAGSKIAEQSGKQIKRTVLELGGSDPHIILDDCDVEFAAKNAVKGRTSNAGQVCIGSKRFLVHKNIVDKFSKRFAELMKEVNVGDPLLPETEMGPLALESGVNEMEDFVENAVSLGAKLLVGGKRKKISSNNNNGYFFEPTVLVGVNEKMNVAFNEVFGPVAPIIVCENDKEIIRIANASEFGLNASIWTRDLIRAKKIAEKINTGGVFINAVSHSHPMLPLGGIKKSGYGRELGKAGIKEFVNVKTVNVYQHV